MWHLLTENPQAIASLYDRIPALEGVDLFSLVFDREGPTLEVRGDLPRFPDHPPERWRGGNFNTARVHLDLIAVGAVRLSGWSTTMKVDIEIERLGDSHLRVSLRGAECDVVAECKFIRIARVAGYQNGSADD